MPTPGPPANKSKFQIYLANVAPQLLPIHRIEANLSAIFRFTLKRLACFIRGSTLQNRLQEGLKPFAADTFHLLSLSKWRVFYGEFPAGN